MCIFDGINSERAARQRNNALIAFRKANGTIAFAVDHDGVAPVSKGAKIAIAPVLKMAPRTQFAFLYALAMMGVERGMIRRPEQALSRDGTEFRIELPNARARESKRKRSINCARGTTNRQQGHRAFSRR